MSTTCCVVDIGVGRGRVAVPSLAVFGPCGALDGGILAGCIVTNCFVGRGRKGSVEGRTVKRYGAQGGAIDGQGIIA